MAPLTRIETKRNFLQPPIYTNTSGFNSYDSSGKITFITNIKYPKLIILALTYILAFFLYQIGFIASLFNSLPNLNYFIVFLNGIGFSYSFTASSSTIFFVLMAKWESRLLIALVAGLGALIGDFIFYKLVKDSFSKEIEKLKNEQLIKWMSSIMPPVIKKLFLPVLGGFIIMSPLPDELGVALLAVDKELSTKEFCLMSFVLNTIGILLIMTVASAL